MALPLWLGRRAVLAAVLAAAAPAAAQLVIDEDFTDSAFNNYNAGAGGTNWSMYGPGTAFRAPNARPFASALSNRVAAGGAAFADGARWRIWNDANNDGIVQAAELQKFLVSKTDDVVILKFTAFSDIARTSSVYHNVEVAMLENVDDPAYQGDPHYGHDLSFEAANVFTTSTSDQVQLLPNVENVENRVTAVRNAHHAGAANSTTLGTDYDNLVLFRPRPGTGTTNIEQWGENLAGDYNVAKEMKSDLDPNNPYAVFNSIQITLMRGNTYTTGNTFKTGVTLADAQIGITYVQVGITKNTDFNLDYANDIEDYFALAAGWGTGGRTMLKGDANNDGNADATDLNMLKNNWGVGSAVDVRRYAADTPVRTPDDTLIAEVNRDTGRIRLVGKNGTSVPLIGYKLASAGGALVAGAADNIWDATHNAVPLHRSTAGEISDFDLTGGTYTAHTLGYAYDPATYLADLVLTWQSALGQTTRTGGVTYLTAPTWAVNSDGLWSNPGNWTGGVPNAVGQAATLGGVITTGRAVTVDAPVTVMNLILDNNNSYTVAGASTLTLDGGSAGARLIVRNLNGNGAHTISAPLALADNLTITQNSSGVLVLSGPLANASGKAIAKLGPGSLQLTGPQTHGTGASLTVHQGQVHLGTDAGVAATPGAAATANLTLIVSGGAAVLSVNQNLRSVVSSAAGGVDLAGRSLRIYDTTTEVSLNAQAGGGLIIDTTAPGYAAIGVASRLDAHGDPSLLVRATRPGDADLDGMVNFADLLMLSQNYNASGRTWDQGDSNYDGTVNFADLLALSQNYNLGYPSPEAAAVPEPAAAALLALAGAVLARRRR